MGFALFSGCNGKRITDSDRILNILDAAIISKDYSYNLGEGKGNATLLPGYFASSSTKAGVDVNQDSTISILDIAIMAFYYKAAC